MIPGPPAKPRGNQGTWSDREVLCRSLCEWVTGHTLDIIEVTGKDELLINAAKWSAKGKDLKGQPATFGGVATHVFQKQPDGSIKRKLHTFK